MRTEKQRRAQSKVLKRCTKCDEVKPLTAFKPRSDRPGQFKSYCYSCLRASPSNIAWKTSERAKGAQRRYDRKRRGSSSAVIDKLYVYKQLTDGPMTVWLKKARNGKNAKCKAGTRGVPRGTLTPRWVEKWSNVTHCPVTGLPFVLTGETINGAPHPLSPSVDRIDPSEGYTDSNCRVVSCFVNFAKNAWSDEQFKFLVLATASNMRH